MKILVTGGLGFIGSNFLEYMLEKYPDYDFVNLDNLSVLESKNNINLFTNYPNYKFVLGDITDELLIDKLFNTEKFDLVVNFAAEIQVDYSIENPNIFIKTNILGTSILMNAALKYNVKKFQQISTDEVYGDLPLDSSYSFKETDLLKPSNPYAASKAAADLLALSFQRTFGLDVIISRCTNNYGPRQSKRALIPLVISKVLNDEKIPVFGNGENIRDWLYVLDHVRAIDHIIHHGISGNIYNISSQNPKTNLEVINQILNNLNKSTDLIEFVQDRPGHDLKYSLDCNKINQLGWTHQTNFKEGLIKTINFYK